MESVEKIQKRATKLLPELKDMTYTERLKKLKLPSLAHRRRRGDMIQTFTSTTKESRAKFGTSKMYLSPHPPPTGGLGCCQI